MCKTFLNSFHKKLFCKCTLHCYIELCCDFTMNNITYFPQPGCPSQWPVPSATSGHAHSEVLGPMDSGSHLGVRHKRLEPTTDHLVSVFPFFGPLNFKPTLCVWSKLKFQDISTVKDFLGENFYANPYKLFQWQNIVQVWHFLFVIYFVLAPEESKFLSGNLN